MNPKRIIIENIIKKMSIKDFLLKIKFKDGGIIIPIN